MTSEPAPAPAPAEDKTDKVEKADKTDKGSGLRMHPVHSMKKRFSSVTIRKSTIRTHINAEFSAYRTRLDDVLRTLRLAVMNYEDAHGFWNELGGSTEKFTEGLEKGYINGEAAMKTELEKCAEATRALRSAVEFDADAVKDIKEYLDEIENTTQDYGKVEKMFTEVERYKNKNERIEKKKNVKQEKKKRSMTKLDNSRTAYNKAVEESVDKMKKLYAKFPEMAKTINVAFWNQHHVYASAFMKHTGGFQEAAAKETSLIKKSVVEPLPEKPAPAVETKPTSAPLAPEEPSKEEKKEVETEAAKPSEIEKAPEEVKAKEEVTAAEKVNSDTAEAPPVKKMEEKITDAAKVTKEKDNTKPLDVPKVKAEIPTGRSTFARLPSFKKIFRRSSTAAS